MIRYLDTSAVAKVILKEKHSAALRRALGKWGDDDDLVSSQLMAAELHRLAWRLGVPPDRAEAVTSALELVDLERSDFLAARDLTPAQARTLDVLHVAVAKRLGAPCLVTYDERQADVAKAAGLGVSAPR